MRRTAVVLWTAAGLLAGASCRDPLRVRACPLVTDDGFVTLHATSGSPGRTIAVPEAELADSINTGRWELRCER